MQEEKAIKTDAEPVVTQEEVKVLTPTVEDLEAKYIALEAEKARLMTEKENYKVAFLKEKSRKTEVFEDESDEEKIRRISREELANSGLAGIAQEQDGIITKVLKENKELKLAQLNHNKTPSATLGTHTETISVKDTLVTPEQEAAFRKKGWDDKRIANYKKNLLRYGAR